MREVELKLVANNNAAVASVRELATASQKLHDNYEKQQKRQVGLIADIEKELGRLQTAQKNAMSIENITKYNQKIAEAKQSLQEYNEMGVKVEKQGQTMMQSIGKWALGIGAVTTAVGLLKGAFEKTIQGMIFFTQVGAGMDKMLSNIVNGTLNWNEGVVKAMILAKEMALLKIQDKRDSIEVNKLLRDYNDLYQQGMDQTLKGEDRLKKLTEAKAKYIEATNKQIEDTRKQAKVAYDMWKNDPTSIEAESRFLDLYNRMLEQQRELTRGTMRITSSITGEMAREAKEQEDALKKIHGIGLDLQKAFLKDEQDAIKEANDKKLKLEQEYQTALNSLIDKYNASNIASKTGVDKLKAQKDFALEEITALKNHLINASLSAGLGGMTEMQDSMIETLRNNVQQAFLKGMEKEAKATPAQKTAIAKALLSGIPSGDEIQKYSGNTTKPTKPITSIWEIFGIDPESDEGKKEIEGITKVYDTTIKMMDDLSQKRVEDAQRTRELLDTQVSEAQSALEQEIELYKAGYASNVSAKQKEVADLKKVRDKAILDETAAIQRQRQIQAISQTADLLSATASLIKIFAKIPAVGLFLAAGAIVAMFKIWDAAKKSTAKATGYAKGGRGEVTGRLHSQGGERFLDHVEIEQGEKWGVLSRSASRKYGNTFYRMVDSFNRDALVLPKQGSMTNNVLLDTSMTNSRLERVEGQLIKLNNYFEGQEQISDNGRMVISKKGSTTRTIKR